MNQPETQFESLESRREQLFSDLSQKTIEIRRKRNELHPYDFTDFYKKMRKEFIKQYPEFKNIIETVFGINSFIRSHENFNYHQESLVREQQIKELINLASWQHRATEILIDFGWDKTTSDNFWQLIKGFYQLFSKYPGDFEGYKRGVIGQARAFLILRELGYSPTLATPKEDVLEGTDFYIFIPSQDKKLRTQIKASSERGQSVVELVDCGYSSIVFYNKDRSTKTYVQEKTSPDFVHLRQICGDLSQREGKIVKSLMIILAESDFGLDGRPKPGVLEKISREIREIENKLREIEGKLKFLTNEH